MKSFLRWAGSKKQIVTELAKHCSNWRGRYVEPFAGSSCLFFHLEPPQAILGDLNWELICTMRTVRSQARLVLNRLREMPIGETAYYSIRSWNPRKLCRPDLASRFLYLNHYCFNGLYRTNGQGILNVRYGPPRSGRAVDEALVLQASRVLKRAVIVHGDFEEVISRAEAGDFVYLDPPYVVSSRRVFSEYGSDSFSSKDLARLEAALIHLDRKEVTFLITYADSAEARRLLRA